MPTPRRLAIGILDANGDNVRLAQQAVIDGGTRVNATATTASTAEAAIPAGGAAGVMLLRASAAFSIRFGITGMSAAANDNTSILVPGAGTYILQVASTVTHFRAIRLGAADVPFQLETVSTQG